MSLARIDASVEINLKPNEMIDDNGPHLAAGEVTRPWAAGSFRRLDTDVTGKLWVCKLGWWKDAAWDIVAYAKNHRAYPCEPTLQQLYDSREFEAYRELGASSAALNFQLEPPAPAPAVQSELTEAS